jgi:hypothetical protein
MLRVFHLGRSRRLGIVTFAAAITSQAPIGGQDEQDHSFVTKLVKRVKSSPSPQRGEGWGEGANAWESNVRFANPGRDQRGLATSPFPFRTPAAELAGPWPGE